MSFLQTAMCYHFTMGYLRIPKAAQLEYLGFKISREGILPLSDKVQAIKNIVPPTTKKQLRSFIVLLIVIETCGREDQGSKTPYPVCLPQHFYWKGLRNMEHEACTKCDSW